MIRTRTLPLLALASLPLIGQSIPATINYQGRLTDNTPSQTPINTTVQMQFALYDAAVGGTRLWQEPAVNGTGTSIVVNSGIFNYVLGNAVAIPPTVFTGATSARYLQITLNPAGSAEILTPRQLVTSTGYANLAENANSAADSAKLGGVAASGWQKALATQSCTSGRFYSSILQNGTVTCSVPAVVETDPEVGTLSDTNIPVWDASQNMLIDSTLISSPVGNLTVPGALAAGTLSGAGSGLTSLDAGNIGAGTLALARGGTAANLSATGGAGQVLKQSASGAAVSVAALAASDIPNLDAAKITSGTLALARGGTNADLSATGGAGQVLKQSASGAAVSVAALAASDIPNLDAAKITSGTLALARGGTNADLSATGGAGQVLKQSVAGAAVSVAALAATDIPNLDAAKITTGTLALARGGTGANLSATGGAGQLVKQASAGGVFTVGTLTAAELPTGGNWTLTSNLNLDSNTLVVDQANNRVGIGAAAPAFPLDVTTALGFTHAKFGGATAPIYLTSNWPIVGFNAYVNPGNLYGSTGYAGNLAFNMGNGGFEFQTAPSGTINTTATMTDRLIIGNTGPVTIPSPGTLSIGMINRSCTPTTPIFDCACLAGETVVSGGGYANGAIFLRESRPTNTTTWRATCTNTSGVDVTCTGMNIICARLAP